MTANFRRSLQRPGMPCLPECCVAAMERASSTLNQIAGDGVAPRRTTDKGSRLGKKMHSHEYTFLPEHRYGTGYALASSASEGRRVVSSRALADFLTE